MTREMPPGLEIRVLGPLEVLVDGAPLVVDTRKALAILALLAVEGRAFARDELAALLWPEADDESARGALRRTLSVLRAALGDRWLRVDRASIGLEPDGTWIDLVALEAAVRASDVAALRGAAELARGSFLAGFTLRDSPDFDDWRATRASAVERSVAGVLDLLAAAADAGGDTAGAVAAASRRVDLDPLDEPAQRRLMALLARSGDRGGAIRRYRACVAVLERELGVAPLAETTELYEAIRDARVEPDRGPVATPPPEIAASGPPPPPPVPERLPHVGRDAEVAAVLDCYASVSVDGRVAVVTGEAGIGKTRLAEAVVDAVGAAGGLSLVARAFASEAGIAYGPIIELLRAGLSRPDAAGRLRELPIATLTELERLVALPEDVVGAIASRLPSEITGDQPAARSRLLEAIASGLSALASGPVPGLIVVEDLQWADDASREGLAWLGRRLAGRRLLLLLTWRPEDLEELETAFVSTIENLPGVTTVTLHRLDRPAVERLVAAAISMGLPEHGVDALLAESEGLPLYLVEALAAGTSGAEGPARSVRTLLRERLAAVSETATQVLSAAAVIGRSFHLHLVHGTSGRSEDETIGALEELVRRGIVRELGPSPEAAFDFAHAKLRDAAYEATSLARRRLLHRRTADLLRSGSWSRDDAGRLVQIATHELEAGRDAEAAEAFRGAGIRERALYANREAAGHLETALALGHPDIAGIQLALGEIRTAQGDYVGAITALEASAAVVVADALPAVELRLGRVHARRGDLVTAASHLDAAIEALEQRSGAGDADLLVRSLVERAVVAHRAGDLDRAAGAASRALALAERSSDPTGAGAAHRMLGLVSRERGDLDAARASLGRSLALAEADPDAGAVIAARNALALVEAAAGNLPAAIALLEGALETCRRTGERHLEAAVENNLADQLHAAGRPDEAMAHLKRAVTLFAEVGGQPGELEPEIWKLVAW
jgi:DNA-binding SARP family transcriptional activator/tetratricopeptide (TPR) repeat protein